MLKASDEKELTQKLAQMHVAIPLRSEGRTKEDTQRYAIAYLLSTLGQAELEYPVSLTCRERPDFLLTVGDCRIGIEHTEAVSPNEAHETFLREKGHGPEVHFVSPAQPGAARKSAKELIQEIERDDRGSGCAGDFNRQWADAMLHTVQQKLVGLGKPGFERFQQNWLLVYDNWCIEGVIKRKAAWILRTLLAQTAAFKELDRIFVISRGDGLCDFSDTGARVCALNDLWPRD